MGNCLKTTRVVAENEPSGEIKANQQPAAPAPALTKPQVARSRVAGGKKVVRFKLSENSGEGKMIDDESVGGVLRIKVVVSQKELKQILNDKENNLCSLEQMMAELRMRGRTVSEARTREDGDRKGSWRPALESIPEELFH